MEKVGGARQYLVIDLATEQWEVRLLSESTYARYPGGESLALHLWSQFTESSSPVNPSQAPLILTLGSLAGSGAPCSNTLTITGLSATTHVVGSATAPASVASYVVACGWQAVVILGVARRQMTLHIDSESVRFVPSEKLLQKRTSQTVQLLSPEGDEAVLCIGPAGEQGLPLAAIMHEGRAVERRGFGAVMGGKHIKALVISRGPYAFRAFDDRLFSEAIVSIEKRVSSSTYVKEYQQAGPLILLDLAKRRGFSAIDNVTKRTDPRLFHIGASECTRKFALERSACENCLLSCQRNVMRPGGQDTILPNAQEMMALGSNIGNYDPTVVMQLRERCIDLGLHPVSTGMLLGCIMDAVDRGFLDDVLIRFGETSHLREFLESLVEQSSVQKRFGGGVVQFLRSLKQEHATVIDCQIAGREMAPYDPRGAWGQALMLGLHEDTPFIPELLYEWLPTTDIHAKAEWVIMQENFLAIMRSIGLCDEMMVPLLYDNGKLIRSSLLKLFSRFPTKARVLIDLAPLAQLLSGFTGIEVSTKQLLAIGRRTVHMRQRLQGLQSLPAPLPIRFLLEPESNCEEGVTVPYTKLVTRYQFLRTLDCASLEEE